MSSKSGSAYADDRARLVLEATAASARARLTVRVDLQERLFLLFVLGKAEAGELVFEAISSLELFEEDGTLRRGFCQSADESTCLEVGKLLLGSAHLVA